MFANIDQLRGREGVDKLIRGLVGTPVENVDDNFSEEVTSSHATIQSSVE